MKLLPLNFLPLIVRPFLKDKRNLIDGAGVREEEYPAWDGLAAKGTVTWPNGDKYIGEFKDGYEWKGAQYDKDGNVTATFSEGVWKRVK